MVEFDICVIMIDFESFEVLCSQGVGVREALFTRASPLIESIESTWSQWRRRGRGGSHLADDRQGGFVGAAVLLVPGGGGKRGSGM